MKIAFVGSVIYEEPRPFFKDHPFMLFRRALLERDVDSVFYIPCRKLSKSKTLPNGDEISFIPCSIPLITNHLRKVIGENLLIRRTFDLLETFVYLIRVLQRLPHDKVDVCIILHLWTATLPLLNPVIRKSTQVALLYQGSSLLYFAQFRPLYYVMLSVYKLVLRGAVILAPLDVEQNTCLLEILKLPSKNVHSFNPCCVDQASFRELPREQCVRSVKFDTTNVNILCMCKMQDPKFINKLGTENYSKDVFLVLETFRCLARISPKVHLHIVGRGEGVKELKARISEYNLNDKVTVHGWIDSKLRPIFTNAADVIINPYPLIEFNDASAIFEAFICGKPVIAYKRYPWVPTEQKGGFLIDRDPEIGAQQILSRLNPTYLAKKSREAKEVPHEQCVTMPTWSKKLLWILNAMTVSEQ